MEGNEELRDKRTPGEITRQYLKNNGIKSPSTENKVELKKGLWVVPNKVKDLEKLKKKYKNSL